jgi:uncharacterized protein (DUF433 family)
MALAFLSGADLAPISLYFRESVGASMDFRNRMEKEKSQAQLLEVPMNQTQWKYLEAHPQSYYKQLYVKGTRIRAEAVYARVVDGDPPENLTPEEIAEDMSLPIEAVREAIAYCDADPPEIREDHARERASMRASGMIDEEGNYVLTHKRRPKEQPGANGQ